jgi:hypothetical protein
MSSSRPLEPDQLEGKADLLIAAGDIGTDTSGLW